MWLMTKYGFFSIVCAAVGRARKPDPDLMMIRARNRKHLTRLRWEFTKLPAIRRTTGTDYPYRIIAPKDLVLGMVFDLTAGIEYTNFKEEAARVAPKDTTYHDFLCDVWVRGCELTPLTVRNLKDVVEGSPWRPAGGYMEDREAPGFENYKPWQLNPAWHEGDPLDKKYVK